MNRTLAFLMRRRGGRGWHLTDILSYTYLVLGMVMMFGPVVWLVLCSFKTQAGLIEFPPSFLPYSQKMVAVQGYKDPLPLFKVKLPEGATATVSTGMLAPRNIAMLHMRAYAQLAGRSFPR